MFTGGVSLGFHASKLTRYAGKVIGLSVEFTPTDGDTGDVAGLFGVPVDKFGRWNYTADAHFYTEGKPGRIRCWLHEGSEEQAPPLTDDDGNVQEFEFGIP